MDQFPSHETLTLPLAGTPPALSLSVGFSVGVWGSGRVTPKSSRHLRLLGFALCEPRSPAPKTLPGNLTSRRPRSEALRSPTERDPHYRAGVPPRVLVAGPTFPPCCGHCGARTPSSPDDHEHDQRVAHQAHDEHHGIDRRDDDRDDRRNVLGLRRRVLGACAAVAVRLGPAREPAAAVGGQAGAWGAGGARLAAEDLDRGLHVGRLQLRGEDRRHLRAAGAREPAGPRRQTLAAPESAREAGGAEGAGPADAHPGGLASGCRPRLQTRRGCQEGRRARPPFPRFPKSATLGTVPGPRPGAPRDTRSLEHSPRSQARRLESPKLTSEPRDARGDAVMPARAGPRVPGSARPSGRRAPAAPRSGCGRLPPSASPPLSARLPRAEAAEPPGRSEDALAPGTPPRPCRPARLGLRRPRPRAQPRSDGPRRLTVSRWASGRVRRSRTSQQLGYSPCV